jgi:hypothetical protein
MNREIKVLIYLFVFGNSCWFCNAQKVFNSNKESIIGVYQVGREVIYLMPNNLFYLRRTKQLNDVIIPECTDTIAKGKWQLFKKELLWLKNSLDYNQIAFDIKQVKNFSEYSIYIKIKLPIDDAFFKGRFQIDFFFFDGIVNYQSTSDYIVLPKDKVTRSSTTCNFSLSIKDVYPNCNPGKKCYQRIYFNVFESLRKEVSLNCFVITLPNFDECFVERMDVDNDLIYHNGKNSILWRGKEYKKVKEDNSR